MEIPLIKQALLNILKKKFYSLINIAGFSISLAAILFIGVGDFIYRTPQSWWFFGYAGMMIIAVAFITAYY